MPVPLPGPTFAVAAIAAAVALVTDLSRRRIPNWLTGGTLLIGLLANLLLGGVHGGLMALLGAALGFAILVPFYALRAMGAGDVKLLAALGAVLGPQALVSVAVYGALAGGLQALVILGRRRRLTLAFHQLAVMHAMPTPSGAKAPYAVAIAAGVCIAMLLPPVLRF